MEPGIVIALVVIGVTIASVLVYAGVGGALGRWREDINKPRRGPTRDRDDDSA